MMMTRPTYLMAALLLTAVACRPSKQTITDYRYFEKNLDSLAGLTITLQEPVIQKNDLLNLQVSSASLNQEQVAVFNLMNQGAMAGGAGGAGGAAIGYLVDYDGTLTFPIIGRVQAAGLTKRQLADTLTQRLQPYVKNPVINIRFLSFRVLMMGEVAQKGWITFPNERATIVEAIAQAGGATEQGLRDQVLLIRQDATGTMQTHRLNINDALIYKSPVFQLQQNDLIYVLPNESKLIQYERANSPFFRDLPVYLGLITSILAFATLIISLTR